MALSLLLQPAVAGSGQLGRIAAANLVPDTGSSLRGALPVAAAGVIVWSLWLYRFILSRLARPIVTDFSTSTSVVVPSFHEDPDILMRCLETWRAQDPTEIIIVLDVADLEAYDRFRPWMMHGCRRSCSSTPESVRRSVWASALRPARSWSSPTPTPRGSRTPRPRPDALRATPRSAP